MSGNTVIKIKSVIFFNITLLLLLLLLLLQSPHGARASSHQSDAPQYIKTLDSADLMDFIDILTRDLYSYICVYHSSFKIVLDISL
jgi:hypothetical protein